MSMLQQRKVRRSRVAWLVALLLPAICFAQGPDSSGVQIDRDLEFATIGDQSLKLHLYRPEDSSGNVPVVVLIYGGAWMARNQAMETPRALWLARNGFAAAVIDHRLSSEALFPAQINDCKAAVRWLHANGADYGVDADHIGAWGASSGGYLASLLGVTGNATPVESDAGITNEPGQVQAVVDFFGPTDLLKMQAHSLPGSWLNHDAANSPESLLVGAPIQENQEKAGQANPIRYVTRDAPPFFIVHGEQDPLVPCNQSERLFDALKQAQADVTFYKIAGAGHGGPEFESDMMRAAVMAFLNKHLKP